MPRPMHLHRGLAQPSRVQIAHAVMEQPGIGLSELSDRTGLHPNTLRDHVRVLVDEGIVRTETEHRPTRGRPRTVYFPVDAATDNDAAQRRIDEAIRHGDLLRRILPPERDGSDEAGTRLEDDAVHQLDALYEHLDEVGLDPELDEAALEVLLHPCPVQSKDAEHREVLCRVHEGLIRDVLDRAGGPVEVDRLLPLVSHDRCELYLRLADSAS